MPRSVPLRPGRLVFAIVSVVALLGSLLLPATTAVAQQAPFTRGIDPACPTSVQTLERFPDAGSGVHGEAVNCIAYYEISVGAADADAPFGRIYDPDAPVTREQMATFVARTIEFVTGEELPLGEPFPDVGEVHGANVRKLVGADVVVGREDGTFGPDLPVSRAQMASFIARALRYVLDTELPAVSVFPDVSGTHAANIDTLAAIGVVGGRSDGTYDPDGSVTRAQMGSFLARSLAELADRGVFPELVQPVDATSSTASREQPAEPGTMAVTDVAVGDHDRFGRIVMELDGAGTAGWDVEYVEQPRREGTGDPVEVAGDAALRVAVTGVASPDDLPEGLEIWDGGRLEAPDAGVLTEVVDDGVVDGRHTLFVGIEAELPFAVARLTDPQRVVIDVFRGFRSEEAPGSPPPRQTVSSFTTPLVPGQARNTNIHLAADYIDGDVIPAGGTYSLNQGIGRRTSARGFVEDGFIDEGGDVISVVGGGVSQMGTTFLNAAWFAGIQIDEFRQHTIYFERYPMCREATLAWGQLDVVVTNDSPYDITIETSYTSESVTVGFVARPWADVESWIGDPYAVGAVDGPFSVDCGRTIAYPDGTTSEESYSWRYDSGYPG